MTVQSDLKKAIASAQSAKGTYLMAAESTEDQSKKKPRFRAVFSWLILRAHRFHAIFEYLSHYFLISFYRCYTEQASKSRSFKCQFDQFVNMTFIVTHVS